MPDKQYISVPRKFSCFKALNENSAGTGRQPHVSRTPRGICTSSLKSLIKGKLKVERGQPGLPFSF